MKTKTFKYSNNTKSLTDLQMEFTEKVQELEHQRDSFMNMWADAEQAYINTVIVLKEINDGKYSTKSIIDAMRGGDVSLLKKARHTKRCPITGRFVK